MNDQGIERSALLLVTLGEDAAAEVLKHLGPREVHKIGSAMASLRNVPREKVIEVLDMFDAGHIGRQPRVGRRNADPQHADQGTGRRTRQSPAVAHPE
jgi:flagellar motor switch protein FliG